MQQLIAMSVVAVVLVACIPSLDTANQSQVTTRDPARELFTASGFNPGLDPGVLTGQLQNGFRYYLRSTKGAPLNDRLEVRLIVKAGSLYERPDQHGYTHLLEHMAYRGTSSFSAQDIELLLSRNGLRWGADVNATTHYGATVYRFSLTPKDSDLLPEIFSLMSEWLDSVEFDPIALENEKRIVDAELRERYADRNHIIDPVTRSAYAGSRYSSQHPAGNINTIRDATADGLKQFWKSHYRADNAALVITGSDRPWQLEPLIASHFSELNTQSLHSGAPELQVQTSDAIPGVRFFKDGTTVELQSYSNPTLELPQLSLNFISRLPEQSPSLTAKAIENRFRNQLLFNVYSYLLRDRIENIPECSSIALEASLLESMQMVEHVKISLTEKNLLPCLAVAMNAVDAVSNARLTVEEFSEFRQLFEEIEQFDSSQYRSRNAASFADGLVDMVTNGEYVLSSWSRQEILKGVVEGLDRETLNRLIANIGNSHRLVYSVVTNQPVPPAMSALIAAANSASGAGSSLQSISTVVYGDLRDDRSSILVPSLDTLTDSTSKVESAAGLEKLSSAVKQVSDGTYHEWQLDNGSTVLFFPDKRFDHVAVTAIRKGGYATRTGEAAIAARSLPEFLSVNGVDGYTSRSLRRFMEEKQLRVKPFVSPLYHGINASGRADDLPTLLTMVNSYFEEPLLLEPQSSVFLQRLNQKKSELKWQRSFWSEANYPQTPDSTLLDKQSFVKAHQALFANAAEFDFVFVGSVDPDELQRQLVRISTNSESRQSKMQPTGDFQFANTSEANPVAINPVFINPVFINHGTKNTEFSLLFTCQAVDSNDTVSARAAAHRQWRLLSDIVAERLRYSLREELGIVYEIESDIPISDQLIHQINFSIAPADEARAATTTVGVLAEVSTLGISESELAGALARDIRRTQLAGSDYQSMASDRAQQLLLTGSAAFAGSYLPVLDDVNHLARCISHSARQVTLDSFESFRPEGLEGELTRPESALQPPQIDRR